MAMTVDSSRQIYVRQNNNSTLAQMVGNSCVWTQHTANPWWAVRRPRYDHRPVYP